MKPFSSSLSLHALVASLALSLGLAACGGDATSSSTGSTTASSTTGAGGGTSISRSFGPLL
ncbi:MAG: hypothetical protein ABI193_24865, partial [Minicystis sp.]